jgi:hypothetical protein
MIDIVCVISGVLILTVLALLGITALAFLALLAAGAVRQFL